MPFSLIGTENRISVERMAMLCSLPCKYNMLDPVYYVCACVCVSLSLLSLVGKDIVDEGGS